jgi:hypothetical protein
LTEEQKMELFAHVIVDKGAMVCPECQEIVSSGIYCSNCGEQVGPTYIPCTNKDCMSVHPDPGEKIVFCDMCGWVIGEDEFERKMISGEITPDDIEIEPVDPELVKQLFEKLDDFYEDDMVI